MFLRLVDDKQGGFSAVEVSGCIQTSRRYLQATNILETTLTAETGRAVLLDLMPLDPPATVADDRPDGDDESRIIRLVSCVEGRINGMFRTKPTFDYARANAEVSHDVGGLLFGAGRQACMVRLSPVSTTLADGPMPNA